MLVNEGVNLLPEREEQLVVVADTAQREQCQLQNVRPRISSHMRYNNDIRTLEHEGNEG